MLQNKQILSIFSSKIRMMTMLNKILIADDQLVGRQLMESMLYKEDYTLIFAEDGAEAYEKALAEQPDLIILDIMMPKYTGFEVTEMLRNQPEMENIPIMLVTALDDRDSKLKGLQAGANDYITKPIDRLELIARVRMLMKLINASKSTVDKTEPFEPASGGRKETSGYNNEFLKILNMASRQRRDYILKAVPDAFMFPDGETQQGISGCYVKNGKAILFIGHITGDTENALLLESLYTSLIRNRILLSKNLFPDIILNEVTFDAGSLLLNKNDFSGNDLQIMMAVVDPTQKEISYTGVNSRMVIFDSENWNEHNTQKVHFRFNSQQKNFFEIVNQKYEQHQSIVIGTDEIISELNNMMWYEEVIGGGGLEAIETSNAYATLSEEVDNLKPLLLGIPLKNI
jgi:CheY-like chemotaxis protein